MIDQLRTHSLVPRHGCKRHRKRPDKDKTRSVHLWPFINLEDLVKPDTLLTYINARGRNLPCQFAFADRLSAHVEKPSHYEDSELHRMLLFGRNTPRSYGEIQTFSPSDCEGCIVKFTQEVTVKPAHGVQILEIQSRILGFLLRCCQLVLKDHDLDSLFILPSCITPDLAAPANCSITSLAIEAPYRVPQKLESHRLLQIVKARVAAAEDHIWNIREDPGYFAHELAEWYEHSSAHILDQQRTPHPLVGSSELFTYAAADMVVNAYGALVLWNDVHRYLKDLDLAERRARSVSSSSRKAALQKSFGWIDRLTFEIQNWPMDDLNMGLCASPPLRAGYMRESTCFLPRFHEVKTTLTKENTGEQRLHRLFRLLFTPEQHDMHGLSNIVEEVQRAIEETERGLLSSWVAQRFSDLAVIVEVRRQLDMLQPCASLFRMGKDVASSCGCESHMCDITVTEEFDSIRYCIRESADVFTGITPSDLPYPSERRRNETTVKQMRDSERLLDEMWQELDGRFEGEFGMSLHLLLNRHFQEWDRCLSRTPRWKAREAAGTQVKAAPKVALSVDSRVLSELDPNARVARPSKSELICETPIKDKLKTRGLASPTATVIPQPKVERKVVFNDSESTYIVNKRSLKVFAALFHVESDRQAPHEIPWIDFLYAMGSIGFSTAKLFGSSWQCSPPVDSKTMTQPIQFHEPHPGSKLRFFEAKKMGRRLHRTYGWTGDMFVCK